MQDEKKLKQTFEGEISDKPTSDWKANPWVREFFSIALIVAVIIVLRSSVFNFYIIPTGSMIPTIKINDRVIANKLEYGLMLPFMEEQILSWKTPKRGDIVLFQSPRDETTFVKRVVGIENDKISFNNGRLLINDIPVDETEQSERNILNDQGPVFEQRALYLEKNLGGVPSEPHYMVRGKDSGETFQNHSEYRVPLGKVFCMGDNRDGSSDSRIWGFVDANRVYGKALFIIWSTKDPKIDGNNSIVPSFRFERFFNSLK